MQQWLEGYLLVINIAALLLCGLDKAKAQRHRWRIPERTLLLCAAAGGSVGLLIGMGAFHHKTRKPLFFIGVPVILLVQLAAVWFLFIK